MKNKIKNKFFKSVKLSLITIGCALTLGNVFAVENSTVKYDNILLEQKTSYGVSPTDTAKVSEFFAHLPFDKSIKIKYGSGKNILAVFADAKCPYCLQLEKDLYDNQDAVDATTYVFLVNIHEDKEGINDYIWCSNDPKKALHSWYRYRGQHLKETMLDSFNNWKKENSKTIESYQCNSPVEFNTHFFSSFFANDGKIATPTLVFSNGLTNQGTLEVESLVEGFKYVDKNPLSVPGFEQLNDQKTIEQMKFFKIKDTKQQ